MKYVKPSIEIIELETNDIMSGSNGQGSITANGTTITGKENEFSAFFEDLLG